MILVEAPRGHLAVSQESHAEMCGQLARAWGNGSFVAPRMDQLILAAERHEMGMRAFDASPALDPASALPATVMTMDLGIHLEAQLEGPRLLEPQSPYAALLVSLKHCAMYERPSAAGRLRPRGRRIGSYLDRSAEYQSRLRSSLRPPPEQVELDWRLVRTWDALSHSLLLGRVPSVRREVPASEERMVDLRLDRDGVAHTLDPWPFSSERVVASAEGRLLEGTFSDEAGMRRALGEAEVVELSYELVPA